MLPNLAVRAGGPPRRYAAAGPSPKEEIVPSYRAPVDEVMFLLTDVLEVARYDNLPGFADAAPDLVLAVLREAAKLCEEVAQPLNRGGDQEGCARHHDGSVTTPKGFKEAYRHYVDGGWMGISAPQQFGGQGLPGVVAMAIHEFMNSANMAFAMYPGLTQGALAAILIHGTTPQKALYLPAMVAGRWTGTMNLTEPQCGTDLGLLRTKAVKQADGSYRITGTKIFISAGEHDLAENIVHLVLARIEGAPAGIRGISLFIVPKILPDPDGALGARNAVACGAIEAKMGIHGNATCVMNYDGATGWLLGGREPRHQRHVHDDERGAARRRRAGPGAVRGRLSERRRLRQGAPAGPGARPAPKFPDAARRSAGGAPDVRAMLLTMRAFNEAARALVMWTALQGDVAHRADEPASRQAADDHMALLTPVIKAMLTDRGFANAVLAQQIFGGHGYIAEHGMEQFVRDARIAMLYEGANGIQALDLVGRKLAQDDGRALRAFMAEVADYIRRHGEAAMQPYVGPLASALGELQQATAWLMRHAVASPMMRRPGPPTICT